MATAQILEFANVTLTFGTERVMADLLDEIVLPALLDNSLVRKYGGTTYFFHKMEELNLGTKSDPIPAVGGTFIKDTKISREQIWNPEKGELEKNSRTLRSSPSATFIFLLANHKLLYLHETSQAPGIDAFRGTFQNFLMRKYMDFINQEYEKRRSAVEENQRSQITKKSLKEQYLPPEVSVIPLSSGDNLSSFINRFGVLSTVKVELSSVNAEADNDPLFRKIRTAKNAVGAQTATLIEYQKSGLNKVAVNEQLASVALEGNARVKLSGLTAENAPLDVSNEEIRLRVPMTNMPEDLRGKADRSLAEFQKAIASGDIIVGQIDPDEAEMIRNKFRS